MTDSAAALTAIGHALEYVRGQIAWREGMVETWKAELAECRERLAGLEMAKTLLQAPTKPPVEPPAPGVPDEPDEPDEPELPPIDEPEPPAPPSGAAMHSICPPSNRRPDGTFTDALGKLDYYDRFMGRRSDWLVLYPGRETPNNLLPNKGKVSSRMLEDAAKRGLTVAPRVAVAFLSDQSGKAPGTSLRLAAEGKYDEFWRAQAKELVRTGHRNAIVGFMHEADLPSWPWALGHDYKGPDHPENFSLHKSVWQRAVNVFRSVSPDFRFDWTHFREPHVDGVGGGKVLIHPDLWFPGKDYVTFGGIDLYDGANNYTDESAGRSRWAATRGTPTSRPKACR
jgi:hypothetical protein